MRKLLLALTLFTAPAMAQTVNVPISQYRDYNCEELVEEHTEWRKVSFNALMKAVDSSTPRRRNHIPDTSKHDAAREEAEAHIRTIQRAAKRIDCELVPVNN